MGRGEGGGAFCVWFSILCAGTFSLDKTQEDEHAFLKAAVHLNARVLILLNTTTPHCKCSFLCTDS